MAELPKTYDPGDVAASAAATSIDRRTCTRVVPMRLICLGLSRTGTTSLRQALIYLGYDDCYQYTSLTQNLPDCEMWIKALEAKFQGKSQPFTRSDWDQLLGHCQAVTDTPCILFYKELLAAYPEAKVVVTVRDSPDQWFDSIMSTIIPWFEAFTSEPETAWQKWRMKLFSPVTKDYDYFCQLIVNHAPYYRALMDDRRNGTETAKKWYVDYLEELKTIVPQERLLVFNVKQGWEPLCKFLDHDVPALPFPRRNDMATFMQNVANYGGFIEETIKLNTRRTLFVGGAVIAGVVGLGAGLYLRRRL